MSGSCGFYNGSTVARTCYDCTKYVASSGDISTKVRASLLLLLSLRV